MAEFEAAFTSLSKFAPELVASEERRCIEFEKRLRRGLKMRVGGSMIRDYGRLVDAATLIEIMMQGRRDRKAPRGVRMARVMEGDREASLLNSLRVAFLERLFQCQVQVLGKAVKETLPVSSVANWATSLQFARRGEEYREQHHLRLDLRARVRVEASRSRVISVVRQGT